jgi:signal transduction histidine kinase
VNHLGQTTKTHSELISAVDVRKYLDLFERLSPLIGSHSDQDISQMACDLIAELLDVEACSVLLPDRRQNEFYLSAARHIPRDEWASVRQPMDRKPVAGVFNTCRPLLINGEEEFLDHFGRPSADRYPIPSCVIVPLVMDKQCLGVINIAHPNSRNQFTVRDVELIESAARLISNALAQADQYNKTIELQRHLQCIFDDLHVGLIVIDPGDNIKHVNHQALNLFGHPDNSEFEGSELTRILPGTLYNICKRLVEQNRREGSIAREQVNPRIGEVQRAFNLTVSQMRFLGGGYGDNLIMIEDVGQELEVQRIRQAENIKHSILSIISHELRTPLAVIRGAVPLIDPESTKPVPPQALKQVHSLLLRNCERLNEVVNTILDITEIENGTLELNLQDLDFHELLREVVDSLQPDAIRKKVNWEFDLGAVTSRLKADPRRIRQAFRELGSNAIKFSPAGQSIRVSTRTDMDRIIVEITNHGERIEDSDRKVIFEKFFQCDQSSTRKVGGVGLGLFLVENLIRLHEGSVTLKDSSTDETTFMVSIPHCQE